MENLVNHMNFWNGKRIFLTGHTGFKGSWLTIWFKKLGAEVTGYSLDPPTQPNLFELANVARGIRDLRGDVRDSASLRKALNEACPEFVFHLAAQPLVRDSYKMPVETYSTNVMGTVNLLEAVRGIKSVKAVLNITTDKCYENREWLWGYRENEPLGGYDPYSNSKACSELITAAYRNSYFNPNEYESHGVALASARAGNVIGGGDWALDRLVPDFVRAVLKGKTVLIRNTSAIRPWQYVLDPLWGYLLLARKLFEEGPRFAEAWNFGPEDTETKSVGWLIENLCAKWGNGAHFEIDTAWHPHEAHYLQLDCTKAHLLLGWHPRWNLEKALDSILEWTRSYRDNLDLEEVCLKQIEEFSCGEEVT